MVPAPSLGGYRAARERAGLVERSDVGRIIVSGRDRRSYLHGLLTNDIEVLEAGEGCYAAYLTAQGRMICDLWVYELGDVILLTLPRAVKDVVLAKLDQFVFSEDVQLGDVTDTLAGVAVVGPLAAAVSARVLAAPADTLTALAEHGCCRAAFHDQPAIVLHVSDTGESGYELIVPAALMSALHEELHSAGTVDVDEVAAAALRVEAGVPKFGPDMSEDTIPLEAGIEGGAISMTKGCYVGQEVIVRVLHRGHGRIARKLVGLSLEGSTVPPAGSAVQVDGRDVGRVTSPVWSPALGHSIALGYVQRDLSAPGTRVEVTGTPAVVVSLPFVAEEK